MLSAQEIIIKEINKKYKRIDRSESLLDNEKGKLKEETIYKIYKEICILKCAVKDLNLIDKLRAKGDLKEEEQYE